MHVRITAPGAELNGHRFPVGTVLDLPEAEAGALLDGEVAEIMATDAPAEEGEGTEGDAKKPATRGGRSKK